LFNVYTRRQIFRHLAPPAQGTVTDRVPAFTKRPDATSKLQRFSDNAGMERYSSGSIGGAASSAGTTSSVTAMLSTSTEASVSSPQIETGIPMSGTATSPCTRAPGASRAAPGKTGTD